MAVLGAFLLLGYVFVTSGAVREAGMPNDIDDLVGRWELVDVNGAFDGPVPHALVIEAATPPPANSRGWVQVRGVMTSELGSSPFVVEGLGFVRMHDGAPCPFGDLVDPHDPDGLPYGLHTMTHFCPPFPNLDHWTCFPDGPPLGLDPNRRSLTYERE